MSNKIFAIFSPFIFWGALPACSAILGFNPKEGDGHVDEPQADMIDTTHPDGVEADFGTDRDTDGPPPDAPDLDAEGDGETPAVCDVPEDCPDDGNYCNGEEYCDNTDTKQCGRHNIPAEETPCGTDLICKGGSCVPVSCGNGVIESPEECDDGRNGNPNDGCRDDCTYSCHENPDCDDSDPCNGSETCDAGGTHRCQGGSTAADRTPCTDGLCCGGICRTGGDCCRSQDCDDSDSCNGAEACDAVHRCRAGTSVPDMTSCADGVCCGGLCRTGGDCCLDANCTGHCSGNAAACSEFYICNDQLGCYMNPDGSCSGSGVGTCNYTDLDLCVYCGCGVTSDVCNGTPPGCLGYDLDRCNRCGLCTWTPDGDYCVGDPAPCSGLGASDCSSQEGCSWGRACTFNVCQ